MKLSHKDFILLIGILVAAAIALSTWMNSGSQPNIKASQPQMKKALNSTTSMVIDKLMNKVQSTSPTSCNSN